MACRAWARGCEARSAEEFLLQGPEKLVDYRVDPSRARCAHATLLGPKDPLPVAPVVDRLVGPGRSKQPDIDGP